MMFSLSGKNDPFFAFFFCIMKLLGTSGINLLIFSFEAYLVFEKCLFDECFSYIYVCALYACLVPVSNPLKLELQLIVCAGN